MKPTGLIFSLIVWILIIGVISECSAGPFLDLDSGVDVLMLGIRIE